MEAAAGGVRKDGASGDAFTKILLSWSLDDISNKDLYSKKMEKIPTTFVSKDHYQQSFINPLLEETRADLHSSLEMISTVPCAEVTGLQYSKTNRHGMILYDVAVNKWRNRFSDRRKEPYKTLPGDVLLLVDTKPHSAIHLKRVRRTLGLAVVTKICEGDYDDAYFEVKMLREVELGNEAHLHAVFLISITPSRRIWNALHMSRNWDIIRKVLDKNSMNEKECNLCSTRNGGCLDLDLGSSSDLNNSQRKSISACIQKTQCEHRSTVELIWGPPGTGKTKTTSMMLFWLLKTKCRSLVCAPTNVAVMEVASRVLKLVRYPPSVNHEGSFTVYPLGDILLFGSKERLKVGSDVEEIYLDYRVERIAECLAPSTGWRHCITSMINFLRDSVAQHRIFLANKHSEEKTFLKFLKDRFRSIAVPLERHLSTLCTHMPKSLIEESLFHKITELLTDLEQFETLIHRKYFFSLRVENGFPCSKDKPPRKTLKGPLLELYSKRCKCITALQSILKSLRKLNIPNFRGIDSITKFCFQQASLIFCTASNTYNLHSVDMAPLDLLVIDEAAQLRECESMIPLQLRGLKHAILVGDERQLPSMLQSHCAQKADFGRSLFGRLSYLGAPKHLLNVQYRMHPSISCFPNDKFYGGQIEDAPKVRDQGYQRSYLPSPPFGPYSFINIADGREQRKDKGRKSLRNSVEMAVVLEILNNLYKEWVDCPKEKLSVGVISPYAAQVGAIREKLGPKYENLGAFTVKVMTVDGFQGGEEDIIIISTVRSNCGGSIGFLSSPQRTNVALTRARYCLWILGSQETLTRKGSEWTSLVKDAKDRQCFFNAEDEEDLATAILEVKKEDDQLEDLLYDSSLLFKNAKWKVIFPKSFCQSFKKIPWRTKSSVVNYLKELSHGWRSVNKIRDIDCPKSTQVVKVLEIEHLHVIWTIDIEEQRMYSQSLKFWFIVPEELIERKVKYLDSIYEKYSANVISRCKEKCLEGDLEVPMTWDHPSDYVEETKSSENHEEDANDYADKKKLAEALYELKEYERAGTLFESVGEFESAADCFYKLQQYEWAGKFYLEKCGESALPRAAECFYLAGCYYKAAEIHARCNMYSECLSACAKGKFFDLGTQFIQTWEGKGKSTEIEGIKQDFLEIYARHCHDHGDNAAMMRLVEAFQSLDMMRNFLRSLDCLDELLCLEEEMGNFYEAANVAKMKGDLLLEPYLFGKGGHFKDASISIIRNILFRSLWESGSKGWPLKQLDGKEELVAKAKSYALLVDELLYEKVKIELTIIVDSDISLDEMQDLLSASQRAGSIMGEILCSWKILDRYLSMDSSKLGCKDFSFSKQIFENHISLGNLMSVWNLWKDKIVLIIQSVERLGTDSHEEYRCYMEFCLNYLGAFKHSASDREEILLINPLAEWGTSMEDRFLGRQGRMVAVEVQQFISVAQKYWGSELISVGFPMLHYLNAFSNSVAAIHIYEVAKFLLDSKSLNCSKNDKNLLLKFIADSSMNHFHHVFPSDWRKSARADLISLRDTKASWCLLKEYIEPKKSLSYGQLGHLAMIILEAKKLHHNESYENISNQPWKALIDLLYKNVAQNLNEVLLVQKLHGALQNTYSADWRKETDYISPNCFLYLIERLLILSSCSKAQFFTTKSGFAEWFIHHEGVYTNPQHSDFEESADFALGFVSTVVFELTENEEETRKWIVKSNMNFEEYYPLMVLKLVVLACLLHTNYGKCSDLLFNLLSKKKISKKLPREFYLTLWDTRKGHKKLSINANVLAEAFAKINDPLVVVSVGENVPNLICRDAILLDMTCRRSKEDILRIIFPETVESSKAGGYTKTSKSIVSRSLQIWVPSLKQHALKSVPADLNDNVKSEMVMELWKVLDTLKRGIDAEDEVLILSFDPSMKVDLDKCLSWFYLSLNQYIWDGKGELLSRDGTLDVPRMNFSGMIDDLRQISTALHLINREQKLEQSVIRETLERLQSRRSVMEPLLHQIFQECCSSTEDTTPVHPPPKVAEGAGSSELPSNGKNNETGSSENTEPEGGKKKKRKKKKKVDEEKVNSSTDSIPPK